MPEENNNKSVDVVNKDDYNKVVEAHNSMKTDYEKMKREVEEFKKVKEVEQKQQEEKNEWQKALEEQKQQMEELKKQVEQKKTETVVAKGVVSQQNTENNQMTGTSKIKQMLDEVIPTSGIKDVSNLDPIMRYGYYQAPTRAFSNHIFGRALNLDASRHVNNHGDPMSNFALKSHEDIVVHRGNKTLG